MTSQYCQFQNKNDIIILSVLSRLYSNTSTSNFTSNNIINGNVTNSNVLIAIVPTIMLLIFVL